MKEFFKEFKEFAVKGNVVDLAVGVVIGAAFGKIVSSLVADIFTPLVGLVAGGVNFKELSVTLRGIKISDGGVVSQPILMTYGNFLQSLFDFGITAIAIFLMIKLISRMRKNQKKDSATGEPKKSNEEKLLEEIRDLLKARRS
jgi:large conductance mechanosensitive channel